MRTPAQSDITLTQCQRFEIHAQAIRTWSLTWPLSTFTQWLTDPNRPLIYHEYALTALALIATAESGAFIDAYDSSKAPKEHQLFHQIARIEWETRNKYIHPTQDAA